MSALRPVRLLGFAPVKGIGALESDLAAIAGPEVWTLAGDSIAAVLQTEPHTPIIRRGRRAMLEGLHTVQRRLETCCQAGPFLPMDPAAATAPAATVTRVLGAMWSNLASALERHGATQQWDVILRWSPEAVVAAHRTDLAESMATAGKAGLADAVAGVLRANRAEREAALIACLTPAVLAIAPPAGAETEVALTVLVPHGGDAAIETALGRLAGPAAADAALDLRGPLPPLSFFPVRLAMVEQSEVASAWCRLELGERADLAALHRQWRQRAAALHPDRTPDPQTLNVTSLSEVTDAYRLLRGLLPGPESVSLPDLLGRAGYRLMLPADDPIDSQMILAGRLAEAVT